MTYAEWIKENVPETRGTCREVTRDMLKAFPHLRRVRGHYHCWIWGEREHWWLVNGGEIIDPTVDQFPSRGQGTYVELPEDAQTPTGRCPNCGDYCFDGEQVHEHCHDEFLRSLGI
jgi:hypothetical protein